MNTAGVVPQDRLKIIKHQGHPIYSVDFTHCSAKELLTLLDRLRTEVARHAPGSLLILADFTGAKIDKVVATRIKEVLVLDRPYVKRSAWIGTKSLPRVFYEHFKTFSQRDLPVFKTRDEALEWLVSGGEQPEP